MTKKRIAILLVAALLVCVFFGCSKTREEEQPQETIDLMEIKTSHCTLYYPQKWQEQVRFDVTESTVVCYAVMEGHDEVSLFDIYFGQEEGYLIGTVEETTISVKTHSLELDDGWDPEQQIVVYEMQEDINYMIEQLQNLDNFVAAQ